MWLGVGVGATDERKVVLDSLTLSGCRPQCVNIEVPGERRRASGGSSVPVIQFQQGSEHGRLFRSLSVAPLEIVYDADVFALSRARIQLLKYSGLFKDISPVGHGGAPNCTGRADADITEAEQKLRQVSSCAVCASKWRCHSPH